MMAAYPDSSTAGGGSMSAVYTRTETGWHVLKVKRYSQTKQVLGVGNTFKSTAFAAGGHRWRIGYYADGYSEDTADCICFDLFLDEPDADADVKARFVFSLLDHAGQPVPAHTAVSGVETFSRAVPSYGFEQFIDRAELESPAASYLMDDSFSVRCDVTVFEERSTLIATAARPPPRSSPSCARVAARFILWFLVFVASWAVFTYVL